MKKILVINTGSTSTKVALYFDKKEIFKESIEIPLDLLNGTTQALQQLSFRIKGVNELLMKHRINLDDIDMIATRGGVLPQIKGGAYQVDSYLLAVSKYAPITQHESSLACVIGAQIASNHNIPVIIYDAVSSNDQNSYASITGYPEIKTTISGHPLNARIAARTVSEQLGINYEDNNFIVAHLGGSISVSAHLHGKIVDMSNAFTGPMSPQRAGRLPSDQLMKLCYSGKYTYDQLRRILNGKSGFMAYFGTQNSKEIFERYRSGDMDVALIVESMSYQVSKAIAEMRIALGEDANAIILTGGMAYANDFVELVKKQVSFLAPVYSLPGEREMEALAYGALRVLNGDEVAKQYRIIPEGYSSTIDFLSAVDGKENKNEI